jgi:hypothetical protein
MPILHRFDQSQSSFLQFRPLLIPEAMKTLFILFIVTLLTGCDPYCPKTEDKLSTEAFRCECFGKGNDKNLIVIGIDVSVSTKEMTKIDSGLFFELGKHLFCYANQAAVIVYPIGNPNRQSGETWKMTPFLRISENAKMSIKTKFERKNKAILAKNIEELNRFITKIQAKILKSPQNHSWTDINKTLEKMQDRMNEDTYAGYTKILLLSTDGKHSLPNASPVVQHQLDKVSDLTVFLSGWEDRQDSITFRGVKVRRIENPNSLCEQLKVTRERLTAK